MRASDVDERAIAARRTSMNRSSDRFLAGTVPGTDRDVVILKGTEPQLRWRTFGGLIADVAESLDATMIVTLGALVAPAVQQTAQAAAEIQAGDESEAKQSFLEKRLVNTEPSLPQVQCRPRYVPEPAHRMRVRKRLSESCDRGRICTNSSCEQRESGSALRLDW